MTLIKKFFTKNWQLLSVLTAATLLLSYNINKPFWGHHDWNGVYWGIVAKNFANNGPWVTNLAMTLNTGPFGSTAPNYNFHYFPFFTLLWAFFLKIFGFANWVSRIYSLVFSLGSITVFFKIIKQFYSLKTAVISSLFWISTAMFIYFGKMPVHEIPLMFFVLLSFWFYLNKKYLPLFISITLAELITWPGFFLVPAITIHYFLFGKSDGGQKNFRNFLIILWILAPLLFGLHLLHDYYVTGNFLGGGLGKTFFLRVGSVPLMTYVLTLGRWAWTYYFLLLPLSFFGVIFSQKRSIPILFFLFAIFYPTIFRDASFRHDYLLIYFWPVIALGGALAINRYLLTFIVIFLMLTFRFKFIMALETSDIYRESARLGEFIHDNSLPGEKIKVITADSTVPWDGWFTGYYADRAIVEKDPDKTFTYLPGGKIIIGENTTNNGTK